MQFRGVLSLAGAIVAAVALVSASGAAPAKNHNGAGIDVSSRAAIVHYLRAIHVNPTGLVIQRGRRNYAGARCPGTGWTCTRTTHPVVQVARAGGKNTFACSTARCAVVQVAMGPSRANKGTCIRTTGLSQSCTIVQSGATADNMAVVFENARTQSGLTQTASATASITQTATGANSNQACVYQAINIDASTVALRGTPVNASLEAHQSVTVTQDALGGHNWAKQAADSSGNCTGSAITQTQTVT